MYLRVAFVLVLALPSFAQAKDLYVHATAGEDSAAGTKDAPLATLQMAVSLAGPGDTIHLTPNNSLFRQAVTFVGKHDVTLDGHGATLDGSDPLPTEGWEDRGNGLRRLKIRSTAMNRHLLAFDGRVNRMGRATGKSPAFPQPEELRDGQFAVVEIDDKQAWLYVRGAAKSLEWSTRVNGVAFGGENRNITIRNIAARRFLNDGFNIHARGTELHFQKVDGYDCFDEGLSAHEACTCDIEDGRFWGNENAVADVNDSETHYRRCEFRDSLAVEALLVGRKHSLVDCKITSSLTSTAISAGTRGGETGKPFDLLLDRVEVASAVAGRKPTIRFEGGRIVIRECRFADVDFRQRGSQFELDRTTLPLGTDAESKTK
jgi:hypothetical protein